MFNGPLVTTDEIIESVLKYRGRKDGVTFQSQVTRIPYKLPNRMNPLFGRKLLGKRLANLKIAVYDFT